MNYYHYKYDEVLELDMPTYEFLIDAMNLAQAKRDIELKQLLSYPHMDKDSRTKVDNKLERRSTTEKQRADQAISTDQLRVAGVSIGNISDVIKDR